MKMTRRFFLRSTGLAAAYCALSPLDLFAAGKSAADASKLALPVNLIKPVHKNKTLVILFLRGGADGLNLVIPYKETNYSALRKQLAIASPGKENGALDLDGFFGLHPRMKAMMPLFDSGLAVAAHAVGYDQNTRSHFEEQDTWETGVAGNTIGSDGWLNRHLATSTGHGPLRAVAIGDTLPRILRGKEAAYALRGIEDLALPDSKGQQATIAAGLEHAYKSNPMTHKAHRGNARDLLANTGHDTLDIMRQLESLTSQKYEPTVPYPKTPLGNKLMQVARLIKSNVGLEVAEVDLDGWDTHQTQAYGAAGTEGPFGNLAQQLADATAAFANDLHDRMDDVLLLTLSDFGRTAQTNGTAGTDHGWANCLFALGGSVHKASDGSPRKVLGQWPGLNPDQLHQKRDLQNTTDFRDVIAEAVGTHLGNNNLPTLLPDHEFKKVGLITA